MLGYIIALFVACLLVTIALAFVSRSGPRSGRRQSAGKPVQPEQPSADEATPDRSATASSTEVAAARRVTPPA